MCLNYGMFWRHQPNVAQKSIGFAHQKRDTMLPKIGRQFTNGTFVEIRT